MLKNKDNLPPQGFETGVDPGGGIVWAKAPLKVCIYVSCFSEVIHFACRCFLFDKEFVEDFGRKIDERLDVEMRKNEEKLGVKAKAGSCLRF